MLDKVFFVFGFCFFVITSFGQSKDPVLMKIGKSDVTVSEFKYIYEKNNGANADYSRNSVMEYLDLYTKFKLKVEKARALQMDTIASLRSELEGYRKQLAGSYLIDKEVTEALLKELYGRMDYDVEFSHIFAGFPENATAAQKEEAKAKLREIKAKLVSGYEFSAAAAAYSEDRKSGLQGGKMGFVTAKLPSGFYELETAIYTAPLGEVTDIIESKLGYHLVKVTQRRPARGIIEVAHILIDSDNKALADSVANLAKNGADFEALVSQFSIDKATVKNGGKLPPFGINTYSLTFEVGSYTLHKDGDVSNAMLTESGWHIIKRIKRYPKDSYDLFVRKMKSQINKDSRFNVAKDKLIEDIKKSAGIQEDRGELANFIKGLDEEFYSYKWAPAADVSTKPLFTLGGSQVVTVKDFADYCKKNTRTRLKYDKSSPLKNTVEELYQSFINDTALAYEEQSLDKKYPEFRSLMREYEEGILLFEVTKVNVWDKANQDTSGLVQFFEHQANTYYTPEKADISTFMIQSKDKKLADKIYKYAVKNDSEALIKKFNKKEEVVTLTKGEIEKGSPESMNLSWTKNAVSSLKSSSDANSYSFVKVNTVVPARPKTLNEARGYVVADYQNYLDKAWLKSLESEYNVVIYKDVLNSLIK